MALDIDVIRASWKQDKDRLYAIRHAVFVVEQGVPVEMEIDAQDETAQHFIAWVDGEAIGCGRLTSAGQIGRMAVLLPFRGRGIGSKLMRAILNYAEEHRVVRLFLHAQTGAIPFYSRSGFSANGETFLDAGITHRLMEHPGYE